MNHTKRIIHVARQVRGLTREQARQAVELYLASAAQEVADGQQVTLPNIGRLQVVIRKSSGRIVADIHRDHAQMREPGYRVQSRLRLTEELKAQCHARLLPDRPGPTRLKPGEPNTNRVQPGPNPMRTDKER